MELSPHMAVLLLRLLLLPDPHFQDTSSILPHVDSEAVVHYHDAHLAVVRQSCREKIQP